MQHPDVDVLDGLQRAVKSWVNTAADSPNSLSLANANASSASAARRTASTGPNSS